MTLRELLAVVDPHFHIAIVNQSGGLIPDGDAAREKYGYYNMAVTTIRPGAFDDLIVSVFDPDLEV